MIKLKRPHKEKIISHNKEVITFKYKVLKDEHFIGFIKPQLYMYVNGLEIGNIKMAYMPIKEWIKYYNTVIDYLNNEYILDTKQFHRKNNIEYKKHIIQRCILDKNIKSEIDNITNKTQINKYYKKTLKDINKVYKKEYLIYKDTNVEKPFIEYVHIYNKKEILKNNNIKEIKTFRGKGYSKYLYIQATKWMNINNKCLYSGVLNKHSKKVWNNFKLNNNFYYEIKSKISQKRRKLLTFNPDLLQNQ